MLGSRHRRVLDIAIGGLIFFAPPIARADETKRHVLDQADVVRLATSYPQARVLLLEGEASFAAGNIAPAAELFERASAEAPHSALLKRRQCQALLELGERDKALAACREAMQREGSPLDMRALVRAILSTPALPTFDELSEASMLTSRAQRSMPRQPWGYAAACDIARRLDDATMLAACRKDLQRIAPNHAETRRALASAATGSLWAIKGGWAAILVAAMATLFNYVRDALRKSPPRRPQSET